MRVVDFSLLVLFCACTERPIPVPVPDDAGQRFAGAICATEQACGCQRFESNEECESYVADAFEELQASIRGFDEECFEAHLESAIYQSCAGGDDAFSLLADCDAFHGDIEVGQPCHPEPLFSWMASSAPCVVGAYCDSSTGLCTESPGSVTPILGPGESCSDKLANSCGYGDVYCHVDECRVRPDNGEPCTHEDACSFESFCAGLQEGGSGTCTAKLEIGDACSPDDYFSCDPTPASFTWCSPMTLVCEDPMPLVCGVFITSLKRR